MDTMKTRIDVINKPACYDYRTGTAVEADPEKAAVDAILLFDGIFLHRPELKDHWDFTVFVHALDYFV